MITVVVADRSPFVLIAVRNALAAEGIEVVAECDDRAGAGAAVAAHRPDALLYDAELDRDLALLPVIRREQPGTAVIVLSPDDSESRALAAVQAGACGFLPKDTPPERLPDVVRGVVAGEAAIPRRVVRRLLDLTLRGHASTPAGAVALGALTMREREVLQRLVDGMSDHEIGAQLGLSDVTVRRHVASAAHKLDADRRADAVEAFQRLAV